MFAPVFIVGPTAVGKTGLALAAAERCGADIVNADAFQVYEGLDLLTAKPSREERQRVRHHLIGTVPLTETYHVARYAAEAQRCLDDIAHGGRPAFVVGGSGMYVKALTHGLSPLPPAQPAIRAELGDLDVNALHSRLRDLDPVTADVIDPKNKRRLIRAIEVCQVTGRQFSEFRDRWSPRGGEGPRPVGVFLVRDRDDLNRRIERRVKEIFARGVLEEVRATEVGLVSDTASRMIGWREAQDCLRGDISLKTCMEKIEVATRRYAKRQMTWFRGESVFQTVAINDERDFTKCIDLICRLGKEMTFARDSRSDL